MKKNCLAAMGMGAILTAAMTITSFAGQWIEDSAGWWYKNDDGSYPVNYWQWIDGNKDGVAECYYFDSAGYMWKTGTLTPDGYQVNADGAWVENGVIQTKAVQTAPAVEKAVQTAAQDDVAGVYGMYDWGTGSYSSAVTMTITKNQNGTYHVVCNSPYIPFTFDGALEVYDRGWDLADPAGNAVVEYSKSLGECAVYTGASVDFFGKIN